MGVSSQVNGGTQVNRLLERYKGEVVGELVKKFSYTSVMQAPRVEKVVINVGLGEATQNSKVIDTALQDLVLISGQKPVVTRAKKSIAQFRVRQGMPIGVKVTLRGERMYQFLDKLMNVALPRVRDFRGVSPRAFDGVVIIRWDYGNS
jgi:large subunit ribosomal protein L5